MSRRSPEPCSSSTIPTCSRDRLSIEGLARPASHVHILEKQHGTSGGRDRPRRPRTAAELLGLGWLEMSQTQTSSSAVPSHCRVSRYPRCADRLTHCDVGSWMLSHKTRVAHLACTANASPSVLKVRSSPTRISQRRAPSWAHLSCSSGERRRRGLVRGGGG